MVLLLYSGFSGILQGHFAKRPMNVFPSTAFAAMNFTKLPK